jgi:hypothetical protein
MKRAFTWIFWYLIANAMLETAAERISKHLAEYLSKMMGKDSSSGYYCPICGEPIVLENMDSLYADADAEGKVRVCMHTACLHKLGMEVCADCARIVKGSDLNEFHVCKECAPTKL